MSTSEKRKILIIEDELIIRLNIRELLKHEYSVCEAEHGAMGIEKAKEFQPDIILCDVNMPVMDGYEVLSTLRNDPRFLTTPFIFLTARAGKGDIRAGMEHGADDYLTKPFTRQELFSAINARIKKLEEAEAATQQKLDILRNNVAMSLPHELLTPLIGLIGCADILEQSPEILEKEDIKELGATIRSSTRNLQRTIENFIFLSRLELAASNKHTKAELQQQVSPSLLSTLDDVVTKVGTQYNRYADISVQSSECALRIGEHHLMKLLEEILSNACKFSDVGSAIHIVQQVDSETCTLRISDSGRGMDEDHVQNIGAYMQFDRSKYEQQGSGLGLAIAKKLCELYGGSFTITSTLGVETTVSISIPTTEVQELV